VRVNFTPEMVIGLWQHLEETFESDVVYKPDSTLMEGIAWALDVMDILDPKEFMDNYGTTIFNTIYIPFQVGEAGIVAGWPLVNQASMAIHEHHHVHQCATQGPVIFASSYLAKKSGRAHWEAEAYRCNMEYYYWLRGHIDDTEPARYARKIKNYGCGDDEVKYIKDFLEMSLPVIRENVVISPVCTEAFKFLENYNA